MSAKVRLLKIFYCYVLLIAPGLAYDIDDISNGPVSVVELVCRLNNFITLGPDNLYHHTLARKTVYPIQCVGPAPICSILQEIPLAVAEKES